MKMLFTGLGRSILGETVRSVWVPPSAYGLWRYSRPRARFLPIRTSQPVNNIYIFILFIYPFSVNFCILFVYHQKIVYQQVHISFSCLLKGAVTAVQFILFNFANYSPSIAMELKVSKEITCKWQNKRSETNKYVSWALFFKLQAAGITLSF